MISQVALLSRELKDKSDSATPLKVWTSRSDELFGLPAL